VTRRSVGRRLMIMDACVLIDFIKTDRAILELVVKHVGPLHVVSPVVDEVNEIESENELLELGVVIVEPEIEDAYIAASQSGPTSFQDQLCLLAAKRYGFACVTNDKHLRTLCQKEGVPLLWGLQLLAELHRLGGIPPEDALDIAQKMHKANPKHITPQILERFMDTIQKRRR